MSEQGTPVETLRDVVYPWECDHMGHLNVQFYAAKFDAATWQLFGRLGLSHPTLQAAGTGMVAVEQHTTYDSELLAGDTVTVESEVLRLGVSSVEFRHVLYNSVSGVQSAVSRLVGVHIDSETRRPRDLPDSVRETCRRLFGVDPDA